MHGICNKGRGALLSAVCLAAAVSGPVAAADASDADELARQLSNPVASLTSVPFQLNFDSGFANGGERWTLNVQPVIPFELNEDWNLISRTILPLISQSNIGGDDSQSGIGDVLQSVFFSPKAPTAGGWIWGAGPALLLPTASDDSLGRDQWALGPTVVVLKQNGGWTYGALANQLWSLSGSDGNTDVNAMFIQPFLSNNFGGGRTVTLNLESTYDWTASQWTIPLNLSYTKVTKVGSQLLSWAVGGRVYLDAPAGGPDWGLRGAVTLLFPK